MSKISYKKGVEIATRNALGESQLSLAREYGVSQASISNALNGQFKWVLEDAQLKMLNGTMIPIVEQTILEVEAARNLANDVDKLTDPKNQPFLQRVDKKQDSILRSVGIFPSNSMSVNIQTIYNDNSKTEISPVVMDILGSKLDEITGMNTDEEVEQGDG